MRRGRRPPTPSAPERRVQPRLTFAPAQASDVAGPRGRPPAATVAEDAPGNPTAAPPQEAPRQDGAAEEAAATAPPDTLA
eukprot:6188576-Alexandrium_andersonii.AAC.1